ncbi:hypothetical protein EON65_05815 [archaeon]|nr:MAG: hypothetical protein EON65_05815 [archaeon]
MSSHHSLVLNLLIWSVTLLLCFLLQHALVDYRWFYIPSSAFVVGFCFLSGWLLSTLFKPADDWTTHEGRCFIADVFYYFMLPIIIFNAGYHLDMKVLKRNLDGILSIALVGTWLNIALLSTLLFSAMQFVPYVREQLISLSYMECVAFSAILSSTDPVSTLSIFSSMQINEDLFYLVLGESLLNDAVAISIFHASSYLIQHLEVPADPQNAVSMYVYYFGTWLLQLLVVFVLSGLLGYILCLVVAWLCKKLSFDHDHISPLICCTLVGYIAFYLAEELYLSGVIACFSAAVNIRRFFIALSLDKAAAEGVSYCIECIGYSAETASMAILGFALILITFQDIKLYLILALLGACLMVRFVSSFFLLGLVSGALVLCVHAILFKLTM